MMLNWVFHQTQVKEELKREKSKAEELNKVKNDLENNFSRLAADLKAIKEKSDKVGQCYSSQEINKCLDEELVRPKLLITILSSTLDDITFSCIFALY